MFFLINRGTSLIGGVFISCDLEYVNKKAPTPTTVGLLKVKS